VLKQYDVQDHWHLKIKLMVRMPELFASLTTCSNVVLAVEADAKDPQFMSKLSQLGPVRVDHHMRSVRSVRDLSSTECSTY
jgi:hypothetical protein